MFIINILYQYITMSWVYQWYTFIIDWGLWVVYLSSSEVYYQLRSINDKIYHWLKLSLIVRMLVYYYIYYWYTISMYLNVVSLSMRDIYHCPRSTGSDRSSIGCGIYHWFFVYLFATSYIIEIIISIASKYGILVILYFFHSFVRCLYACSFVL